MLHKYKSKVAHDKDENATEKNYLFKLSILYSNLNFDDG